MEQFSRVKCGFIAITTVTITLFTLGMIFALEKMNVTINPNGASIYYSDQTLPASVFFSLDYDTASVSSGDSWYSTVIDSLQTSLRSFWIRSGFIAKELYLELSPALFQSAVEDLCAHSLCPRNLSASSLVQLIRASPSLLRFVVPKEYCSEYSCDPLSAVSKNNPLEVSYIESKWGMNIFDIKQLLTEAEQPLLITIPKPLVRYYLPCGDGHFRASCERAGECPSWIDAERCGFLEFEAMLAGGQFFNPMPPASLHAGDPITALLYGWNDEFAVTMGDARQTTVNASCGGFVVKLARGWTGGPMGLFDRTLLTVDARAMCPAGRDPVFWGSDVALRCTNPEMCDANATYTMYYNGTRQVVYEVGYGMTQTIMRRNGTIFNFSEVPYQFLGTVFEPVNGAGPTSELCTFWFLPYDLFEHLLAVSAMGSRRESLPVAEAIAWKWSKSSYKEKNPAIMKSLKTMAARKASIYP
jgi:hypothetical protein